MKIVKEVRSLHPTVRYGNVELLTRFEFENDDIISEQEIRTAKKISRRLDRMTVDAWSDLHDYAEAEMKGRLGNIENVENETKEQIASPRKKIDRNVNAYRKRVENVNSGRH